ncbi:DUF6349 family protein [Streptosporangium sp. NPDC000563]|uniref:DUF6349 family protein n=1 Tax=Streptosporangium sp. NPDC000563 TaxID=3154366 RepID=UPI0033334064
MPTTTQPTTAITHPDPGERLSGHCRVTVTWQYRPDDVPMEPTEEEPFHLRYRSYCGGCGHTGPARSRENRAAEDGCDHAYPGWRDLPVMGKRPYQGKPLARWEEEARAVYPPGWFDRQGPVREYRPAGLTRHVPGYAPGGGYCMAVMLRQPHRPHNTPATVQTSLFG